MTAVYNSFIQVMNIPNVADIHAIRVTAVCPYLSIREESHGVNIAFVSSKSHGALSSADIPHLR